MQIDSGIAWQKEECPAVGVPWRLRGKRRNELLVAMGLLWREHRGTFHREFIHFDKVYCDTRPAPVGGVPFYFWRQLPVASWRNFRLPCGC